MQAKFAAKGISVPEYDQDALAASINLGPLPKFQLDLHGRNPNGTVKTQQGNQGKGGSPSRYRVVEKLDALMDPAVLTPIPREVAAMFGLSTTEPSEHRPAQLIKSVTGTTASPGSAAGCLARHNGHGPGGPESPGGLSRRSTSPTPHLPSRQQPSSSSGGQAGNPAGVRMYLHHPHHHLDSQQHHQHQQQPVLTSVSSATLDGGGYSATTVGWDGVGGGAGSSVGGGRLASQAGDAARTSRSPPHCRADLLGVDGRIEGAVAEAQRLGIQAVDMTPRERVIYLAKAANPSYKVAHPRQVRVAEAAAAGNGTGVSCNGQPSNRSSNRSGTGPQRSISSKSMASVRSRDRGGSCTQVPGHAASTAPNRGGASGLPPIATQSGTSSQPASPTAVGVTPSRDASVASAASAWARGSHGPSAGAGSPNGRGTGPVDTHSPRPRESGTHATATASGPATGSPGEGGENFPMLSPVRAAPGRGDRNSSSDNGGGGSHEASGRVPASLPPLTAVSAASLSASGAVSGRGDNAVGSEYRHGHVRDDSAADKVASRDGHASTALTALPAEHHVSPTSAHQSSSLDSSPAAQPAQPAALPAQPAQPPPPCGHTTYEAGPSGVTEQPPGSSQSTGRPHVPRLPLPTHVHTASPSQLQQQDHQPNVPPTQTSPGTAEAGVLAQPPPASHRSAHVATPPSSHRSRYLPAVDPAVRPDVDMVSSGSLRRMLRFDGDDLPTTRVGSPRRASGRGSKPSSPGRSAGMGPGYDLGPLPPVPEGANLDG